MRAKKILPESILATEDEAKCIALQMPSHVVLEIAYTTSYATVSSSPSNKHWYFIHEISALSS